MSSVALGNRDQDYIGDAQLSAPDRGHGTVGLSGLLADEG